MTFDEIKAVICNPSKYPAEAISEAWEGWRALGEGTAEHEEIRLALVGALAGFGSARDLTYTGVK